MPIKRNESPAGAAAPESGSSSRTWVLKATGVLLVVPALVNALHDVVVVAADLPRTAAQKQNERLYRDYFGKQPVQSIPVSVRTAPGATIEARVSIWDKGDVLVEYGGFTQWFPFPGPGAVPVKQSGWSLLPSAFAQEAALKGQGPYVQSESLEQGALVRERSFRNGVVERASIDPKTGAILSSSTSRAAAASQPAGRTVAETPAITVDLTTARAAAPSTPAERLKTGLAWCRQKSNFFSRSLCESRERQKYCQGDAADSIPGCR